ncbi:MAG: UbiA family prenyltransferase [Terracidiphilus sp.]
MPDQQRVPKRGRLRAHLAIMRLDHSIKNIFVLPGIVVPMEMARVPLTAHLGLTILIGLVSCTLIASSNYVLNEILDAPFDRLHPIKKNRPVACGQVMLPLAWAQWLLLMAAGLGLALGVGREFTIAAAGLWIMGCAYNVRPLRTKDVVYLDVITESINNPLRMLLGWYMVATTLVPPTSLLVSYWMIGCYFMALKRFSEYREIGNAAAAASYRRSFRHYTERRLLESVVFYASFSMLMFGLFIARYRLELIFSFPLVALMMATYFDLAFKAHSAVQNPEKLFREPRLMAELVVIVVVVVLMLRVNLPWLHQMFTSSKL